MLPVRWRNFGFCLSQAFYVSEVFQYRSESATFAKKHVWVVLGFQRPAFSFAGEKLVTKRTKGQYADSSGNLGAKV